VGAIEYQAPDIILMDLLMPGKDGIEIAEKLNERNYRGKTVMISQVENKEMVAQAYAAGIEFYINKPVNRIEVISVIKRVIESLEMERSFENMRRSIAALDRLQTLPPWESSYPKNQVLNQEESFLRDKTMEIITELGIAGEPGSHDLVEIVFFLSRVPDTDKYLGDYRHLKDLYLAVQKKYLEQDLKNADVKAIEQRIRRAIRHAMENIAALGLEDYSNPCFERYGAKFFDFGGLRRKMRELKNEEKSKNKIRVNVKQFINALYHEVHSQI